MNVSYPGVLHEKRMREVERNTSLPTVRSSDMSYDSIVRCFARSAASEREIFTPGTETPLNGFTNLV